MIMAAFLETMYLSIKPSILSLPPIDENEDDEWPSIAATFNDIFANKRWQRTFLCGLLIFYSLNSFGGYIYDRYVPLDQRKKYNREIFASDVTSTVHALMISVSASLVCHCLWTDGCIECVSR